MWQNEEQQKKRQQEGSRMDYAARIITVTYDTTHTYPDKLLVILTRVLEFICYWNSLLLSK